MSRRGKRDCFALLAMTKNQQQTACERDCFASLPMTKHKARHCELFCEAISIFRKIKGRLPHRFTKRLAMTELKPSSTCGGGSASVANGGEGKAERQIATPFYQTARNDQKKPKADRHAVLPNGVPYLSFFIIRQAGSWTDCHCPN